MNYYIGWLLRLISEWLDWRMEDKETQATASAKQAGRLGKPQKKSFSLNGRAIKA